MSVNRTRYGKAPWPRGAGWIVRFALTVVVALTQAERSAE